MRPPLVLALAAAALVAACGGTSVSSSSPTVTTATPPTSVQGGTTSEAAYVDALVTSALSNPGNAGMTPGQAHCAASAIVHEYGPDAFGRVGLSPPVLRDPNSSLTNLPYPSAPRLAVLGAALQRCAVGSVFARALDASFHFADVKARACIARKIDSDVSSRPFLTFSLLDKKPDLPAARALVRTLSACADIETLIVRSARLSTSTDAACVTRFVREHEADTETLLARAIAGETADAQQFAEFLRPAVAECARGTNG